MPIETVQRIVTVCLVLILFEGGMGIGLAAFRRQAMAITWLGVAGTLVTALAMAALAYLVLGVGWRAALLLGTALAPTDPAVVFSVLGRRELVGRSAVLLKGESGANDPVGIALIAALLVTGGATGWSAVGSGAREFVLQMVVGAAVGLVAGQALAWMMRRVRLPSAGLYPLRTLAMAGLTYGLATVAHGSGFLAVLVCGIVVGDVRTPQSDEEHQFHSALASLSEIVAFTVLGLTVSLQRARPGRRDRGRPGAGRRPRPGGPADPRRPRALAGPAEPRRARLRAVGRAEGRRADPAGHLPAVRPRARGHEAVRRRLRGRDLLGRGPGRPGPRGRPGLRAARGRRGRGRRRDRLSGWPERPVKVAVAAADDRSGATEGTVLMTDEIKRARARRAAARGVVPFVGLLAAGLLVWQGSYAAFSATTVNNNDIWTAGTLTLQNNGGGAAYAVTTSATFNELGLKPGSGATKCITVKNTSSTAGSLKMYRSGLVDSAPSLGAQVQVTIDAATVAADVLSNCAGFPVAGLTNVATGVALTALPTTYAAAVGPVAVGSGTVLVAYRISYTFATTGTTAGDNALQGKTVTAAFTWELQ